MAPPIPGSSRHIIELTTTHHNHSGQIVGNCLHFDAKAQDTETAWTELDLRYPIDRTLQLLCKQFFIRNHFFTPPIPQRNANLLCFHTCLDFILLLQKLTDDKSSSIDTKQLLDKFADFYAFMDPTHFDWCEQLPTSLENLPIRLLKKEIDQVKGEDLVLVKESAPASSLYEPYGSEAKLLFRVWSRFSTFIISCTRLVAIQNDYSHNGAHGHLSVYIKYQSDCIQHLKRHSSKVFSKNLIRFCERKYNELQNFLASWLQLSDKMSKRTLEKTLSTIPLPPMISDEAKIREYMKTQLPQGEHLKNALQKFCIWNEEHLHRLETKWKEASALLIFALYASKQSSSKSLETQFELFMQTFDPKENQQKTFALVIPEKNTLIRSYLASEKIRQNALSALHDWVGKIRLFHQSGDFMESTLELYHEAHDHFYSLREKAAAEHQLTGELRQRKPLFRSPTARSPISHIPIDTPLPSSSNASPSYRLEDSLYQAVAKTTNTQARHALYNAISLLDDLFNELYTTTISSPQERIEHLDLLLVNLSLAVEQMLSFKVLEKINPKSRWEAQEHLVHNLFKLCQTLPEAVPLAEALNGVENSSRFLDPKTSSSEGARLLMQVHNRDCGLELQQTVYLFIKTQLESALQILFNKHIVTDEWQARWQQLEQSSLPSAISAREPSEEMLQLLNRIDTAVGKCKSRSHAAPFGAWIHNAQRLFIQLNARVMMAKDTSNLNVTEKRTAGLICLISWSLCIASAAAKRQIDLQQTHISELSKNLWDWIDPILGEAKVDALPLGEQYFCDLSANIYRHNRYQHSTPKSNQQTLWRIGFNPQEEEAAAFQTTSGIKNHHLVTLHDGLAFAERILNTLPEAQQASSQQPRRGKRR